MAEHLEEHGVVHAGPFDGNDITLCGTAIEGYEDIPELLTTTKKINCTKCIEIIDYCKSIGAKEISRK